MGSDASVLNDSAVYTLRRVIPDERPGPRRQEATRGSVAVCVAGLWHLGCVTAACLAAAGHNVVAYDDNSSIVADLRAARLPVVEPGLEELIGRETQRGRLRFEDDAAVVSGADVAWVTWDTPIDDDDNSDVEWVLSRAERLFPHLRSGALVLVSSQLPVGSIAELERRFAAGSFGREVSFACVPENLRLGKALEAFTQPGRIVVGVRRPAEQDRIAVLLAPFTDRIEWMGVESAEMTKHAINAFLATSVAFINEIASLCECVGANGAEVSRGLKSDARIGPQAYLCPGGAFAGGTLARDVVALAQVASKHGRPVHLVGSVRQSNDSHRQWASVRLRDELGSLSGRIVAIWGLTYKPGTNTLRRSGALELCEALLAEGAILRAYDPAVSALPAHLATRITLAPDAIDAARGADAVVITTKWPEFLAAAERLLTGDRVPLVLDANGFLAKSLGSEPHMRYITVGQP